jgi:hypothetical protein
MTDFSPRILLLTSLLFSACACASPKSPQTSDELTEVTIAGQSLKLVDAQGQCALLKANGSTQKTDIAWPCRFSPNRAGESRIEVFQSIPIVLLEHCDQVARGQRQSQAVRMRDGMYETSSVNTSMCGKDMQDQKMFIGLFRW